MTFTATVSNTSGAGGTPTGKVEFYDGATTLGLGSALSGSGASANSTFTISMLSAGDHDIQAVYTPSGNFFAGSDSLTQTVDAVTTTSVASNHNPAALGQSIMFTATVTNASNSGGTPAGAVEFFDGSTDLGAGTALSGSGNSAASTLTISTLALGPHAIHAVYAPSGDFTNGEGSLTQTVDAATSVGVASSSDPSSAGQSVAFTATITNTSSGGGTPAGAVEVLRRHDRPRARHRPERQRRQRRVHVHDLGFVRRRPRP